MPVLLDNNVNQDFALLINGHEVVHARQMGSGELENGDLIAAAERQGFAVMVTADKRMQYQQTIEDRHISKGKREKGKGKRELGPRFCDVGALVGRGGAGLRACSGV